MNPNKHHKRVLVDLIRKNNIKIFAEIGVARCTTLKYILPETELSEYWAVDPLVPYGEVGPECVTTTLSKWESWYIKACRRMIYHPQLRVLRMTSVVAAGIFPDNYFDFVYIDADHRYEYVVLDIEFWLPKVKKGGILGGHDYGNEAGVKKAVDEWFEGIELLDNFVWIKRI